MEVAGEPVFLQESARRNDLDVQEVALFPLCLAEEWALPGADQRLEGGLRLGAVDLDLQVTTAGRPQPVVGGPAGGSRARVHPGRCDRERPSSRRRWRRDPPYCQLAAVEECEPVAAKASWGWNAPRLRHPALESPGAATMGAVALGPEVLAGDVDRRRRPDFAVFHEGRAEIDALGMTEEPGSVVVLIPLDCGNPDGDIERATLTSEALAGWGRCHGEPVEVVTLKSAEK